MAPFPLPQDDAAVASEVLLMRVSLVLLVVSALGLSRIAEACDCAGPDFTIFLAPTDGAEGVPLNTLVWMGAGTILDAQGSTVELLAEGGERLATTRRTLQDGSDRLEVFTPERLLDAGTRYEIALSFDGGSQRLGAFVTGDTEDRTAPASPRERDRETHVDDGGGGLIGVGSSCGPSSFVSVTMSSANDRLLLVGARDRSNEELPKDGPDGRVDELGLQDTLRFGTMACEVNWPESDGDASPAFVGAFDLAGNFSGWTALEPLEIPWYAGCGCSEGGTPLVGLLGLLVWRRRVRRDGGGRCA